MTRINVLWAIPLILPFVFVVMVRLLWVMVVAPWEPEVVEGSGILLDALPAIGAGVVVMAGMLLSVISAVVVGSIQLDGIGIWWTLKREEKNDV